MCEQTGTIFNIQKFSLHDGPGIRTVVFFKGCPLRCGWCANPESQVLRPQLMYDRDKCTVCHACVPACPNGALSSTEDGIAIYESSCTGCGECAAVCLNLALQIVGRRETVDSIEKEVLKDTAFYKKSGGGVTFSGGEPLFQPEFLIALSSRLKSLGIHTAMETTGFASPQVFEDAIENIDLLLFDLKHYDDLQHQEGTRLPNGGILHNLRHAVRIGKPVIARIPVIPGYNSGLRDAAEFALLLKDVGIEDVCLLPFHQFGEKKYAHLRKKYDYENVKGLHDEDISDIVEIYKSSGLNAKAGG